MTVDQTSAVLARYSHITLAFDGDDAGRSCAIDAIKSISGLVDELRVVRFPEGLDPADCDPADYLPGELFVSGGDNKLEGLKRRARWMMR